MQFENWYKYQDGTIHLFCMTPEALFIDGQKVGEAVMDVPTDTQKRGKL